MKREIRFIRKNIFTLFIIGYCVWDKNWFAVVAFILFLGQEIYNEYLDKALKDSWKEIEKMAQQILGGEISKIKKRKN